MVWGSLLRPLMMKKMVRRGGQLEVALPLYGSEMRDPDYLLDATWALFPSIRAEGNCPCVPS